MTMVFPEAQLRHDKENFRITGPLWGGIHWSPKDSPHKRPVIRKMLSSQPTRDVMLTSLLRQNDAAMSFWRNSVALRYIDGFGQDCRNSIANALELLQFCTKPSICPQECYDGIMPNFRYMTGMGTAACPTRSSSGSTGRSRKSKPTDVVLT